MSIAERISLPGAGCEQVVGDALAGIDELERMLARDMARVLPRRNGLGLKLSTVWSDYPLS